MRSKPFKVAAWMFGLLVLASMFLPAVQGIQDPNTPFPTSGNALLLWKGAGLMLLGWLSYVVGVLPAVTVDRAGLITAGVCLVLFVPGLHFFCRWLRQHQDARDGGGARSAWRFDWSLSIAGLMLLMFVAGIAMVGLVHQSVWLMASTEPKAEISFSARLINPAYSLVKIGEASTAREFDRESLPPGVRVDAQGTPLHSWQTLILPFVENLWGRRPDLEKPWDAPDNRKAFRWPIKAYLNPEVRMTATDFVRIDPYAPSHIAGNLHVLGGSVGLPFTGVTDGQSQTILAGQVATNIQPWGKPGVCREPGLGINASPNGFGAPGQGALMIMCDGNVRFFANGTDPRVLKALATPASGEIVAGE